VQEIESQALVAQQQIGLARTQMTAKQREQRLVRLTISEMATLPDDAVVYEGVGKMYVDSYFFYFAHPPNVLSPPSLPALPGSCHRSPDT
jgi:hypothetical protein